MSQNTFIILPSARMDLEGIGEFLGEDSRDKTTQLFCAVREQLGLLADRPYIGSPCNYCSNRVVRQGCCTFVETPTCRV